MDKADRDRIQRNFRLLVEALGKKADAVSLLLLNEHRIFNKEMYEDIVQGNKTDTERARSLLTDIQTRGPKAYEALYQAVCAEELYEAANILRPEKGDHWQKPDVEKEKDSASEEFPRQKAEHSLQVCTPPVHKLVSKTDESNEVKSEAPEAAVQDVESSRSYSTIDQSDSSQSKLKQDLAPASAPLVSTDTENQQNLLLKTQQNKIFSPLIKKLLEDSSPEFKEGPKENDFKNIQLNFVNFDSEIVSHYEKSLQGLEYYVMKHTTRGRAVIIDNERFDRLKERKGTEKDRRALAVLFQGLGFHVQLYKNLKCQEILNTLDTETRLIDSSHDCFVLAILSHGCHGCVFGTDGYSEGDKPQNAVALTSIRDTFCQVEKLVNKPKIFFIQACRGNQEDEGIKSSSKQDQDQDKINSKDVKKTIEKLRTEDSQVESDDIEKTPSHADCFFAMSTTAGNVSYRHTTYGSWFIQATVQVLSQYAHQHDLCRLMTMVNEYVSKNETQTGYKQVSEKTDTFRFLFHFFPGLNEITYQPAAK